MRIQRVPMVLDGDTLFCLYIPTISNKATTWLWVQVGVVFLLVGIGLLSLNTAIRGGAITLAILWMLETTDFNKANRNNMGLPKQGSRKTFWMVEAAFWLVLVVWLIGLLFGAARHISYAPDRLVTGKLGYFLGAALQQAVMQSYIFVRLKALLNCEKRAVKWTALAFSLCHLPNPVLMAIAWAGGCISCSIFRRQRNLWTLALMHGMVGASIAAFWPPWIMRAGIGFYKLFILWLKGHS